MRIRPLLLVSVLSLCLGGCAAHVQHPGTANAFDSNTYDTLQVTNTLIESTKTSYLNGSFPASIMPQVKQALNDLIQAYDVADNAYLAYHNAVNSATGATPAQITAVQTALTNVNGATSTLISTTGASK